MGHEILNLARLPIPPLSRLRGKNITVAGSGINKRFPAIGSHEEGPGAEGFPRLRALTRKSRSYFGSDCPARVPLFLLRNPDVEYSRRSVGKAQPK